MVFGTSGTTGKRGTTRKRVGLVTVLQVEVKQRSRHCAAHDHECLVLSQRHTGARQRRRAITRFPVIASVWVCSAAAFCLFSETSQFSMTSDIFAQAILQVTVAYKSMQRDHHPQHRRSLLSIAVCSVIQGREKRRRAHAAQQSLLPARSQ
jgi:hypothetical protein